MLKLLADENIPRRLVRLLVKHGVNVVRLQDLGLRGINDQELVERANNLERALLTRDSDFTMHHILLKIRNGVIYIAFQPTKSELPSLARRLAILIQELEPKLGLLVVIEHDYIEVYQ